MFGFFIGTLSLIGLIGVWKSGWHGGHGRGFGGPRRWMTRRLFEYLDTTPGQEKVLAQVMDEVEKKAWAARRSAARRALGLRARGAGRALRRRGGGRRLRQPAGSPRGAQEDAP